MIDRWIFYIHGFPAIGQVVRKMQDTFISKQAGMQAPLMTDMETVLRKTVDDHHAPSVQYVLFDTEHIIEKFTYGLADIARNRGVRKHTSYHAFSVTKTFTALAILQLAEQKKLDINQPVKKYWPAFPYPDDITVRQLLSHSAGIPNPIPLSWIHLTSEHQSFDRNKFFDGIIAKHKKVKFAPNEGFIYSNLGYVLLGRLIESVTGNRYEDFITANIIQKLGLDKGELGFEIVDPRLQAKGYHKRSSLTNIALGFFLEKTKYMENAEGRWKPFKSFYVNGPSYGGLIGTAGAFVKYIQTLLKPGHLLLSGESKNLFFTENFTNDNKPTGMCLSWFIGELNGET
jgi:CubicO group peptidase (beta-lactamase class C family)